MSAIREVRVKCGGIYAGYFDNEAAALAAVERLPYTAAWLGLNPLRPDALTPDTVINPLELRMERRTARDEHICKREWLLLDFDPQRPAGVGSTDAEKAAAHQQAEQCRSELAGMGWPSPTVIDSGNGYHLRYRIDLPNDATATALVRAVLQRLAVRYPMLDVTNYKAARVAKLPGSWARKGPDTPERPHRKSETLEHGGGIVSEALLRQIVGDISAATSTAALEVTTDEARTARAWLLDYLGSL